MASKRFLLHNLTAILCFALLFGIVQSDCPISYYPQATFVGSINANIDYGSAKVKQSQFVYNLVQPLTSNSPKVSLMITSLSYRPQSAINFNIFYKPSPSFSQLLFVVNVTQQGRNKWDWLKFSFFASQNKIFQLGSQYITNFTNTQLQSRKLITTKLPLESTCQKPVLKVFLNGLSVISNVTKQQLDQIKTQIDGYKALTWSSSIVKFLQKKLNQRQILQTQLSNIIIENRTLSFFVDLGYKQILEFISFSYVIFTTNQFAYHNEFIQGRFTMNFDTIINAPALNNMDLFFIGIESLKFKQWQFLSLEPSFTVNQNHTFSFSNAFIQQQNSFNMSYFAISKSRDNYCSHCRDGSIVYENFCISDCPQGYVKKYNASMGYCEFCDIKQFKVPNADKNQCVCAMQYFSVAIMESKNYTCSACNYQCLTCESEYKCLTCDSMYLNTFRVLDQQKSQCICAPGYYDDGQNNIKCLKCHQSCVKCRGPTLFDCETCPKGRIRGVDGNCICDANFIDKNGTCVCESPNFNYKGYCFTFMSKNNCSQYEQQVIINGVAKCQCKPGYLEFRTTCILCNQNQKVNNQTGKCICKDTFYKDQQKGSCVACSSDKIYCAQLKKCICIKGFFQTTDGRCVTCKRRQTLINNQCQCIYNYFKNDWGECQRCEVNSMRPLCQINLK